MWGLGEVLNKERRREPLFTNEAASATARPYSHGNIDRCGAESLPFGYHARRAGAQAQHPDEKRAGFEAATP